MRRLTPLALPCLLGLVACAESAAVTAVNARIPDAATMGPPPALVPLGPVLATADALEGPPPLGGLTARIAALRSTAAGIGPAPAPGDLGERLDSLEARAAALRAAGLAEDERQRLGEAAPPA